MEENTTPEESKLDKYTEQRVKEGIEKLLNEKELKLKWRKELEDNPDVVEYFTAFRDDAMGDFLKSYINDKYYYYTFGDMYKKLSDQKRSQWIDVAYKQLEAILQKQLFDKQCLWRAEQISLEGVEIIFDFDVWGNDIFNCPFLDPISSGDIALYKSFLADVGLSRFDISGFGEWQDYDEYKKSYTSSDKNDYLNLPEWYEFHNSRTGNGTLLLMNDIRGKKEDFYINLFHDSKEKKVCNSAFQDQIEVDSRPIVNPYCDEQIALFVEKFENKEFRDKYKYYQEMSLSESDSDITEIVDEIIDAGELVPINSHRNILDAIEIAYNRYFLKKVAEHLPMAHELYLFNKKMNIDSQHDEDIFLYEIRENYKEMILEGRVLNGEVRNLNF